ncbi:hypothetical protein RHMOL_Rhmol13G0273500 [Rhododendron molle]|uniref:Uncharacterized protein n=1 Tax=Rhododendron molle TaxID=49168 RepID=A0ACC0LBQ3_RHOML|nr:hypothetical protein RHMOL_Rhmol13G0273500 [Rhododendron molle]
MIVHVFCIQGLGASEHDIHKLFDILYFQKPGWNSVPEFGGWDRKTPGATDYSVVFSRARANKKQQKNDVNRHSLGNEQELMVKKQPHQHYQQDDSVMVATVPMLRQLWKVFNDDTKRNASWTRREEGRGKVKAWVMVGVGMEESQ